MKPSFLALAGLIAMATPAPPAAHGAGTMMTVQGSATATLNVHASVVRNCLINGQPVDFGTYDPLVANRTQPLDATGAILLICTKGDSPRVELDGGSNAQGSTRRMTSVSASLSYELYSDTARSSVWGSGSQGTPVQVQRATSTAAPSGGRQVYGRIPAGQNATPGEYADTVTATVIF